MTRLESILGKQNKPAFIGFLVAGDPDSSTCAMIARTIIDAGVDILELGMPFSDPVADGPTIQKAHERSLRGGMTTDGLFAMIREIRTYSGIPLVLLTYYNIVYRRGIEQFYREASFAGLDAILIVDMPVEESGEAVRYARNAGIDQIFLVALTTSPERLTLILSKSSGFLYLISTLGVTGVRRDVSPDILHLITHVKRRTRLPIAVGFGISQPQHIPPLIAAGADAIIVGSALVDIIEQNLNDPEKICNEITSYVRDMKQAMEIAYPH